LKIQLDLEKGSLVIEGMTAAQAEKIAGLALETLTKITDSILEAVPKSGAKSQSESAPKR
jgi:hypothetical protein